MARNGSGTYSLPAGNPVVTGTTISSTVHNNTMTDIATAITASLAKDGQTVLTGALDFNGVELILDADGDTTFHASTDDQIDIRVAGADDFTITPNALTALSGSSILTNTISETTAASGVTIDGVVVKDGGLTATADVTGLTFAATGDTAAGDNASMGYTAAEGLILTGQGSTSDVTIKNDADTTVLSITNAGEVTKPYQPAFYATPSSAQTGLLANDSAVTVAMGTEIFDVGSNFASNAFTAPVTGKYQLNLSLWMTTVDTAASYINIGIITSNRNYINIVAPKYASDPAHLTQNISTLADMDAGDTAYVFYQQSGGAAQTAVKNDTRGSFFQGHLVA